MLPLRLLRPVLRLFYKLLYGKMAFIYDIVAATVSLGRWKSWVLSVKPFLKGARILELGHGPGHLQASLLADGFQAYGLDASPQMGRQAQRRLKSLNKAHSRLSPQSTPLEPRLVRGHAQSLPFPSASFDQVVSTFPSEYITDKNTLNEIWRVLAPGGTVVILLGAWITGTGLADQSAAWLFRVTDQAPVWSDRYLAPLKDTGFEAGVEWLDLSGSKLLIVIGKR